jgi:hypothetical protein
MIPARFNGSLADMAAVPISANGCWGFVWILLLSAFSGDT